MDSRTYVCGFCRDRVGPDTGYLTNADLTNADLRGANLSRAFLEGAKGLPKRRR